MVKVPVVNRSEYVMYLELHAGMLWFHTDVKIWNKEVKEKFLKDLDTLQGLVSVPLVALVEEDNLKLAKFGKVTGWKLFDKITLNDGKVGYVYTRSI